MDADQKSIKLKPNKTLITRDATLRVKGGMQLGEYQIQLVVCDECGNTSAVFKHYFSVSSPIGLAQKVRYFITMLINRLH